MEREGLIVHFDRKFYLKFLREYKNKFFNVNYIDTIVDTDQLYTIDNLNQKFTSAWLGCTFFFLILFLNPFFLCCHRTYTTGCIAHSNTHTLLHHTCKLTHTHTHTIVDSKMMLSLSLAKKTKQATHTRTIAWPTEGL